MPRVELIKNSFVGGEISPRLLGRSDLAKYHSACEKISNFIVLVQGGLTRRPGMRYIIDAGGPNRLIPFIISPIQQYVLEFGDQYIRFYTNEGQIQTGGVHYQISSPYNTPADDLWDIHFTQVGSVIYLTHPNHPVQKLIRVNDTNWKLQQPSFYSPPTVKQDQDVSGGNISITFTGGFGGNTITSSSPVFIAGDVGKAVVAGTGVGYILSLGGTTSSDSTGATLHSQAVVNIVNPYDLTNYNPGSWFLRGGPLAYLAMGTYDSGLNHWSASKKFGFGKNVNARAATNYPTDVSWQTVTAGATVPVQYTGGFTDSFRLQDLGSYIPFAGGYGQIIAIINSTTATVKIFAIPTVSITNAYGVALIDATPPGGWYLETPAFTAKNGYPKAVTLFQDRLFFSGVAGLPNTVWASGVGDYENFALGTLDSSGLRFSANSGMLEQVLWMAAFQGNIVAGTQASEYVINGGAGQAVTAAGAPLTPNNINMLRQSAYGVDRIQGVLADNDLIFIQKAKTRSYQFAYNAISSTYGSKNLTVLNEFITTSGFKDMVYQGSPYKVLWFIDNSGQLIGLTYDKEQDIWAWHRHDTGTDTSDSVISIANITASDGVTDELWLICKRLRNGVYVYTIEMMDPDLFLDSAIHTVFPAPVTQLTGLQYLQGRSVMALVDGIVLPSVIIGADGIYNFPVAFSGKDAQIGLNYISTFTTVRPEPKATIQGLIKRWIKVWARVYESLGLQIGSYTVPFRTTDTPLNEQVPYFTGDVQVNNNGYDRDGRITITQNQPLPSNILSIFGPLEISDGV